jgi:3D (Asp-Asp-Asp) domain-containing protein
MNKLSVYPLSSCFKRYIGFSLLYFCISCSSTLKSIEPKGEWITARITYYTPTSPYGNKVACQKTKRAKEGITVAAHPKLKFGTRIEIPELADVMGDSSFIVQDRGSAVTKKVASRGKTEVIDVYLNSNQKLTKLTKTKPKYMKVLIIYHK